MRQFFTILILLISFTLSAQKDFNLEVVSNVPIDEIGSDIWGYVDSEGIEYAIMGSLNHTNIYSLEDPNNPVEIARIEGTSSTWRDIKSFDNYLYVVADQGNDGLLIIDMNSPKDSIPFDFWTPTFDFSGTASTLNRCHNLYIDENGYAYLAGCRNISDASGKRGFITLDLNQDPKNPTFVGVDSTNYSHDVYVRGDTLYSSEIFAGQIGIYDVSNKAEAILLASKNTGFNFTHNAWLSDDGKTIFTTDERPNAFVEAYDIENLEDIKQLDAYKPIESANIGTIPHNTHVLNDFLVTSWYTDGVVVIDANKPDNLVKVAAFDSYDDVNTGFFGCWGAYPFLPSGLLLISDRQSGLFVLNPNYVRASYLEGIVTDVENGNVINGVNVSIESDDPNSKLTNALGEYRTGQVSEGSFNVKFSHPDYFEVTLSATLEQGKITVLNAQLERKKKYFINIKTIDDGTDLPIPFSKYVLKSESQTYEFTLNENGEYIDEINEGTYEVYAGSWSYLHADLSPITIDQTTDIIARLKSGYQDDFAINFNWTEEGNSPRGDWVSEVPRPTLFNDQFANVNEDLPNDLGEKCAMTGNNGNNYWAQDVDRGVTSYISPQIDLSQVEEPLMSYYLWFFNETESDELPNDSLMTMMTNGTDTVVLEIVKESQSQWREKSVILLADFIELTDSMHFIIQTSDDMDNNFAHIVEAGLDGFLIIPLAESSLNEPIDGVLINAYPNPFLNNINIDYYIRFTNNLSFTLHNHLGQQLMSVNLDDSKGQISFGETLTPGMYFGRFEIDRKKVKTIKIIKN